MNSARRIFIPKTKLGSYPSGTVVFSISIALLITGLFCLLLLLAERLSQHIKENIQIQVYLQRAITEEQKASLGITLTAKPYLATKEGKPNIKFVGKEEAAKKFIAETGEDFTSLLGYNPLRDAYFLNIEQGYATSNKMKNIQAEIQKMPGVFEVSYVEPLVDAVNYNLRTVGLVLFGFAVVLVITCVVMINNTVRLALYSQRFLIRSMQLIGAKPSFIYKPFLSRAATQGILSGIVASSILIIAIQLVKYNYPEFTAPLQFFPVLLIVCLLLLLGALLGTLSAWRAVHKYLRLTLDQLYQ